MARYDPDRMELSTRDRVALANYTEIHEGRGGPHGGVYLDISHRTKEHILSKLPRMYRQFIEYQMLDISQGADGGRADCPLFDGRSDRRSRDPRHRRRRPVRRGRVHGRAPRRQSPRRQLADRDGGLRPPSGRGGGRVCAGKRVSIRSPPRDRRGRRGPRHADRSRRRDGPCGPAATPRPDVGRAAEWCATRPTSPGHARAAEGAPALAAPTSSATERRGLG